MTIRVLNHTTNRLSIAEQHEFYNLNNEQVEHLSTSERTPLVNIAMELSNDFNKASLVRVSNAFIARETIFVGESGTLGDSAVDIPLDTIKEASTLEEVIEYLHKDGYTVYAVDNIDEYNPKSVYDVELPEKTAFLYGREQDGLTLEEVELCDGMVYIPMTGAARSLNISQAASVCISEYTRQRSI